MFDTTTQNVIDALSPSSTSSVFASNHRQVYISPQKALLMQRSFTREYNPSGYSDTTWRVQYAGYDNGDKVRIILRANDSMRDGMKDLDPSIAKLVSKNFKKLLWT